MVGFLGQFSTSLKRDITEILLKVVLNTIIIFSSMLVVIVSRTNIHKRTINDVL